MAEVVYSYRKGVGWVPMNSEIEILNCWTAEKARARVNKFCTTCGGSYSWHFGDSCDQTYRGREWTD